MFLKSRELEITLILWITFVQTKILPPGKNVYDTERMDIFTMAITLPQGWEVMSNNNNSIHGVLKSFFFSSGEAMALGC